CRRVRVLGFAGDLPSQRDAVVEEVCVAAEDVRGQVRQGHDGAVGLDDGSAGKAVGEHRLEGLEYGELTVYRHGVRHGAAWQVEAVVANSDVGVAAVGDHDSEPGVPACGQAGHRAVVLVQVGQQHSVGAVLGAYAAVVSEGFVQCGAAVD